MTSLAAIVAAALFMSMVVFQASLALGAPVGANVLGGPKAAFQPVAVTA